MPRSGYTSITVPIQLKDQLKAVSIQNGYSSVPHMIESWMPKRTGTVQVRGGLSSQAPMTHERRKINGLFAEPNQTMRSEEWCDRRDSNPGRLRGRQKSYQAGPRSRIPTIPHGGILIFYLERGAVMQRNGYRKRAHWSPFARASSISSCFDLPLAPPRVIFRTFP